MASKAMIGGLLQGAGKGMVAQGERRREELAAAREAALEQAEAMREEALERARERREREFEREKGEAEREHQSGLLSRTVTGDDGKVYGITRGGEKKDLGITKSGDGSGSGSGSGGSGQGEEQAFAMMSTDEERTYKKIKNRYTNPNTDKVDWQNFISHLRDMPSERGGERWNEFADLLTGSVGTRMSREEAREQAAREANERKGYLSSRGDEFPETDGDQQAWIEMRTNELMGGGSAQDGGGGGGRERQGGGRQSTGQESRQGAGGDQQATGSGGGSDRRPQAQSGQRANVPPGKGTQAAPYKASKQAHIDWFLENAPEGAVIEADGQLYTK